MEDFNADKVIKDQFNPIREIQVDIQNKNPLPNSESFPKFILPKSSSGDMFMQESYKKPSFAREIPVSEAYDLVGDEWMKKFDTFKEGSNNKEFAAQNQSTGDKWTNGLLKLGGKTLTAVAGGTIGVADSIFTGVKEGSISAAYNSDLNKWLDDLNTRMDYKLPNYYTEQEKNAGFMDSLGSANFWANDFLGGLSFTIGAVVSEGIWAAATGGTSLLTGAGRWSSKLLGSVKSLKSLNTYKSL